MAIVLSAAVIEQFSLPAAPAPETQAEAEERLPADYPKKKEGAGEPPVNARGYVTMYYHPEGEVRELAGENAEMPFPVASITKLMTAIIVSELFPPDLIFPITIDSVNGESPSGNFSVGEKYRLTHLLHALLIESNNDAARTFAASYGRADFIRAMNDKAQELGLSRTVYFNASGLDPEEEDAPANSSSPRDVAALMNTLKTKYPDIFAIAGKPDFVVRDPSGVAQYLSTTTNVLLTDPPVLEILAGKTGTTLRAEENLVIVTETPSGEGHLIHVVLGSPDRFSNMRALIQWTADSFDW